MPYAALHAGFAAVSFGMRSAGPDAFFYPPGHPSGRWEDDGYINPYKLFTAAIQWIKSQTKYALDPRNIIPYTASSGAVLCQTVCTGADLKVAGLSGQRRESSAVRGVLSFLDVFDFCAFEPSGFTLANNWESIANPGAAAASLADADPALVRSASTAHWATQKLALAPWTPVFLHADEPAQLGAANDYSTDAAGFPNQTGVLTTNIHDAWHAYMHLHVLRTVNPAIHGFSELWVEASIPATAGSPPEAATGTFADGNFLSSPTLRAAAIDWMKRLVESPNLDLASLKVNPFSGSTYGAPMEISAGSSFGYTADFTDGSSDSFVIQAHTTEVPGDGDNGNLTATRIEGEVISTSGDPASFEVRIRPHHHGLHNAMVDASFDASGAPKQTRSGAPLVWDAPRHCYMLWKNQTESPPLDVSAIVFLDLPLNQTEPCIARVMLRGTVDFRGTGLPRVGPLADLLEAANAHALAHGLRVRVHGPQA